LEKGLPDHSWNPVKLGKVEYIAAGEVARFYSFPRQQMTSDVDFWLRSAQLAVRWRKDSSEILINNVRFELKHPVREHEGGLWISRYDLALLWHPVVKPSHLIHPPKVSTVVIDAGHGGKDAGAIGRHGKESDFTLDTAQRLKRKLEAAGFRVVMTRSDDRFVSRPARFAIANAEADAILISLHFNSHIPDRSGIETFLPKEGRGPDGNEGETTDTARFAASAALGMAVHANMLHRLRAFDGGVHRGAFDVILFTKHPAVSIEGGYLTNIEEGARIATEDYREKLADAVAGGVRNFIKATTANGRINRAAPVPPVPLETTPPK